MKIILRGIDDPTEIARNIKKQHILCNFNKINKIIENNIIKLNHKHKMERIIIIMESQRKIKIIHKLVKKKYQKKDKISFHL